MGQHPQLVTIALNSVISYAQCRCEQTRWSDLPWPRKLTVELLERFRYPCRDLTTAKRTDVIGFWIDLYIHNRHIGTILSDRHPDGLEMQGFIRDRVWPAKLYEELITNSSRRKWDNLPTSRNLCALLEGKMADLPPKKTHLYTEVSSCVFLASTFRQVIFGALFDVTELDLSLI